ncbi:MAG: hypothetical protein O3C57_01165 [Verrucomicrobia bacterium]|nr:hypothetical protein [Verrucomicrobiota bacterium]
MTRKIIHDVMAFCGGWTLRDMTPEHIQEGRRFMVCVALGVDPSIGMSQKREDIHVEPCIRNNP